MDVDLCVKNPVSECMLKCLLYFFLEGEIVGDFDFIIMFDLIFSLIMIIFAFTMIF